LLSAWRDPGGISWLPIGDKVVHAGLYSVLGLALGYGRSRVGRPVPHAVLLAIGALYGVTDEWHQMYVPGRLAEVGDLLADLVGLALGYGTAVAVLGRRKDREVDTNGKT